MLLLSVIHKFNVNAEEHAFSTFSVQDFHYEEGNGAPLKHQQISTRIHSEIQHRHTNRHTFHSHGCENFKSHVFNIL
jgi:hypothetical protein